jgi:hypothetical protein
MQLALFDEDTIVGILHLMEYALILKACFYIMNIYSPRSHIPKTSSISSSILHIQQSRTFHQASSSISYIDLLSNMKSSILSLAALLIASAIADGGYFESCINGLLANEDGTVLNAACTNDNGRFVSSGLDLNNCLANDGGNLAVSFALCFSRVKTWNWKLTYELVSAEVCISKKKQEIE